MSNLAKVALAAAAVVAVLFGASRLLPTESGPGRVTPSPTPGPTVTPTETPMSTATGAFGGTIEFIGDAGVPGTIEIDAVATGEGVSGTAVSTLGSGTHTVRLECAARDGDTWVVGGKVETSTIPSEAAGNWSAVLVRDGPPQRILIWLSDDASAAGDCESWLATFDASLPDAEFAAVESGELVPLPDLAPWPRPSSVPGAFGGTVEYKYNGLSATTEVDGVATGGTVSGAAVSTTYNGIHKVRLACASQNGSTWALGGTVEETTISGESAGAWSAVIVRDGVPQQIGLWLSDEPSKAADCKSWLGVIDFSTLEADLFTPVESGALVPPPDLAP